MNIYILIIRGDFMLSWKGKTEKISWDPVPFHVSESFEPIVDKNNTESNSFSISSSKIDNAEIRKNKIGKLHSQSIVQNFQTHNLLIQGDNYDVLNYLVANGFENQINLIYIDPPFMTNNDFYKIIQLGEERNDEKIKNAKNNNNNKKSGSKEFNPVIRQRQYKDKWELEEYLDFMYDRLWLLKKLLSETGSIYVHLDENCVHYIKVILDEIFGVEHFRRDIIWNTASLNVAGFKGMVRNNWIYSSGHILFYTKSDRYTFNTQYIPHSEEFIKKQYKYQDARGKYRVTRRSNKIYIDDDHGEPITNIWNDILSFNYVKTASNESVFYPTQKPELLLSRIIQASSNPGDIVLDCFNGSGTTITVAEKLNRRWIGIDNNPISIQTTSKRIQNTLINSQKAEKRYFLIYEPIKSNDTLQLQGFSPNIQSDIFKFMVSQSKDNITVKITDIKPEKILKNDFHSPTAEMPPDSSDNYSLCDSVYMEFSIEDGKKEKESNNDELFFINFADIPQKKTTIIQGTYTFQIKELEVLQGKKITLKLKLVDKFGNCHFCSQSTKII